MYGSEVMHTEATTISHIGLDSMAFRVSRRICR